MSIYEHYYTVHVSVVCSYINLEGKQVNTGEMTDGKKVNKASNSSVF